VTDVCVPISRIAECLIEIKRDLDAEGLLAAVLTHPEITPQRLDSLAEDAVRGETVSPGKSPCNLRFAGRFSEIAGRADPIAANFSNDFKVFEGALRTQGAGSILWYCRERSREDFWYCREEQRWTCAMLKLVRAGKQSRTPGEIAGLGICNQQIVTAAGKRG
jgi:hypothetical protein